MKACLSVGTHWLVDPRLTGDSLHDSSSAMTIDTSTICTDEDRPLGPLTDGEIDGPRGSGRERNGDDLPALSQNGERSVSALEAQSLDVRPESL